MTVMVIVQVTISMTTMTFNRDNYIGGLEL